MIYYYINDNKYIIFGPNAQQYIDKCKLQPFCVLKSSNKKYKIFGSLMYINFVNKNVFWEHSMHKLYKLYASSIAPKGNNFIINEMYPACSITPFIFPGLNMNSYNILIPSTCEHKNNCHNRHCKEHNSHLIGYNFPFMYNKHKI